MSSDLHLFEAFGIELEYMVVDSDTLDVRSLVPDFFKKKLNKLGSSYEEPQVSWSNELVKHVIELKCTSPVGSIENISNEFAAAIKKTNDVFKEWNACVLPGAMHPWMNPATDSEVWTSENREIYDAYDRIFSCKGHGWANLQSTHLNLPFCGEAEFVALHTAIRLILPILPALCASSPLMDGKITGVLDNRLNVYQNNQKIIPSIAGKIIPEAIQSIASYHHEILEPMYRDIAPHDPSGILQDEWLNSRGAIARFDRNAIEIRVMDIQECPAMDCAIHHLVVQVLKALIARQKSKMHEQISMQTDDLRTILLACIKDAENTQISNQNYLNALGLESLATYQQKIDAKLVWKLLIEKTIEKSPFDTYYKFLLDHGSLSTRILKALNGDCSKKSIHQVYQQLAVSLQNGIPFGK